MQRQAVNMFKALSDPNRVRIMKMLERREMCVCEVREVLGLSLSTVSKHLSILRDAGLILDAKKGKWVNYRLNSASGDETVRALLGFLRNSFKDEQAVRADRKAADRADRVKICGM